MGLPHHAHHTDRGLCQGHDCLLRDIDLPRLLLLPRLTLPTTRNRIPYTYSSNLPSLTHTKNLEATLIRHVCHPKSPLLLHQLFHRRAVHSTTAHASLVRQPTRLHQLRILPIPTTARPPTGTATSPTPLKTRLRSPSRDNSLREAS
jgi:hypothetical protein